MKLDTKNFGLLDIDESSIITFSEGLPGFMEEKQFTLVDTGDEESPFKWLQSVKNSSLAFAVVNPFAIKKDYDFELKDDIADILGIESAEDVLVYSIVVVPEDLAKMTANLKAPIILNVKKQKAMQIILDTDDYSVRHYILDELRKQEVGTSACTNKEERPVYNYK
jgi:flagellar assembly factor FliW